MRDNSTPVAEQVKDAVESVEEAVEQLVRAPIDRATRLRRQVGAFFVDGFFKGASSGARFLPIAKPALHNVEVLRDIPYTSSGLKDHTLDIYRPRGVTGKLPVVFYIHGGGFRILSKDSHWLFGIAFARRGYLVVNVSYRLAPKHPFPAAIEDVARAFTWTAENVAGYGGDAQSMVFAGESAGANLAASLAIACCYERPEPFAKAVFDTGLVPKAVLPACGMLQVTDPERFSRSDRPLWTLLQDRVSEVADAYLHGVKVKDPRALDLADPLLVFERGERPARPLPPFFAAAGTMDPLIDDTVRLRAALERMGVRCEARYYPGEIHAFHAFVFRSNAMKFWRALFDFLAETCPSDLIHAPRLKGLAALVGI